MSGIDFFDLVQLAEASYAKFDEIDDLKLALMNDGDGFSSTQADLFVADWQLRNNRGQTTVSSNTHIRKLKGSASNIFLVNNHAPSPAH